MGLFEKTYGSTADDVVNYCEHQLTLFIENPLTVKFQLIIFGALQQK
jgi:hypothetical protein